MAAAPSWAAFFGSEELSDCTVVAGGQTLFCHKLGLSMASRVFRAMFRSGMGESNSSRVEIRDAAPEAVTLLLQAIYGQEVAVPLQHLVQLAHLADQYQSTALLEAIIQAVKDKPIVAQALAELLPAAVAAGGTERLVDCLLEQVVSQISSISQAPDVFEQWSPQVVQLLVKAAGGRAVYEALQVAAAWINADKQQRQHHFASLLAHLQLPKLHMAELQQLDAQPEVLQLPGLGVTLFRVMLTKQQRVPRTCDGIQDGT